MEMIAVGLIGTAAAGYIAWRFYKTVRGGSACPSGGCEGCGVGCGKAFDPSKKKKV